VDQKKKGSLDFRGHFKIEKTVKKSSFDRLRMTLLVMVSLACPEPFYKLRTEVAQV